MPEHNLSSIQFSSINVSRNSPLALVVGAAGFIGSHLVEGLLSKNIQVISVDDLSAQGKINLKEASKSKNFHFINSKIDRNFNLRLPRLDYAFFIAEDPKPTKFFIKEVLDFLHFTSIIQKELELELKTPFKEDFPKAYPKLKPKIVFISSINLYKRDLDPILHALKEAEVTLAKYTKEFKLNTRIVRLAPLYGPRMHFKDDDALVRLIKSSLLNKLAEEQITLEFSTRALYIADAISLILKTAFSGSTAHKIYDGALLYPIKVTEIKQLLIDPLWFENREVPFSKLPPWPTPNLIRTIKELSWLPKTDFKDGLKKTLRFFSQEGEKIIEELVKEVGPETRLPDGQGRQGLSEEKKELLKESIVLSPKQRESQSSTKLLKAFKFKISRGEIWKKILSILGLGIILFGFVFPLLSLLVGFLTIKSHLLASRVSLEEGNFDKAITETIKAKDSFSQVENLSTYLALFKRIGIFSTQISSMEEIIDLGEEGIEAANHGTLGMKSLHLAVRTISGEGKGDAREFYKNAQVELAAAADKIGKVNSKSLPYDELFMFGQLIDKTKTASFLLPEITALEGPSLGEASQKSYLFLFQNNFELRPTGGIITSYAKVDFEKGKVISIKVLDSDNLDGNLKDVITPPVELKTDLGAKRFFFKDSNFEPDFPTSARQAEFFFNRVGGEKVHGVIALDLTAAANLTKVLGGLDLPDYGEKITGSNLFERVIIHTEDKNFLTSLFRQLFNKMFYLSDQNWASLGKAFGESLEQKHLLIYLADPQALSLVASQNWAGVLPRGAQDKQGEFSDFLAVNEANVGENQANYYLERKYRLESSFGKEGEVKHHLTINYKNSSPSEVHPGGKYKARLRIYLPVGSKLTKASLGEVDYTSRFQAFSDYNRSGFSALIEILPKEQKSLILEYEVGKSIELSNGEVNYSLLVLKQPGTHADPFEWNLTYPINFAIESNLGASNNQEILIPTNLSTDRKFELKISKK